MQGLGRAKGRSPLGFPRTGNLQNIQAVNFLLPRACHELHAFICDLGPLATNKSRIVPIAKARACAILAEFNKAQTDLVGRAVILTDGKAGTVDEVCLDEFHGLRISIVGQRQVAGLNNKICTGRLTTPISIATPVILNTDEERDIWMRAP